MAKREFILAGQPKTIAMLMRRRPARTSAGDGVLEDPGDRARVALAVPCVEVRNAREQARIERR
ncbi:MAG TPA: hypothetical protein VGM07_10720 [Stellaceae bacterium]